VNRLPWRRALLVALVLAVVAVGVADATARGNPVIEVAIADPEVHPGETTTVELTLANEAELDWADLTNPDNTRLVQTARGVSVEVDADDAPVTIESGDHLLGSLAGGASIGLPVRLHVADDAEPGTYELDVVVEYVYTSYVSSVGATIESDRRVRREATIEVTAAPRFSVASVSEDLRAGETGTVSVTLENVGTATARRASLSLAAADADVTFGDGTAQATSYVGNWAPGDQRTFVYRTRTARADAPRTYTLRAVVDYRDADGVDQTSRSLPIGVSAAATPTFAVEDVSTSLRVGERGTVSGTIVNTGATAVRDAVVVFEPPAPGIRPTTTERSVGDLAPGERAGFSFPVDVAEGVAPGSRQLSVVPRYTSARGASVAVEPVSLSADVAPEREPFEFAVVNGTVAPDQEGYRLTVDVTNVGDVTRREVVVALQVSPPFTTTTPTVFVQALEPGEATRLTFELSVDEDAVAGTVPVAVNVTSDTPARSNAVDGPYLLPVEVAETAAGTTDLGLVVVAGVIALLVLGAGWWWLRG